MTEPESSRDRDDHWWRGHLGWLLGGVPILLALIRVAAVARFDPATASAIVSKADTLAILSNVFFLFAPVLLLVALDIAAHSLRTDGLPWFIIVLITGTPAVAVMVTAPISYVLVALLSVSYVYVARFGIVSRYSPPSWRRVPIQSRASVVAMVVSLAMVLLLFDVWIPSERLTHSGGQAVGYVLGEEGGWLTVLRASDRSVSIVRSADVTDRKICRLNPPARFPGASWLARSLYDVIFRHPDADRPLCIDSQSAGTGPALQSPSSLESETNPATPTPDTSPTPSPT